MKKLLKSEICGSVNSARMHCSWKTWSKVAATVHEQCMNSSSLWGGKTHAKKKKKKKKKKEEEERKTQETKRNVDPNCLLYSS